MADAPTSLNQDPGDAVRFEDIEAARRVVRHIARHTPVITSSTLSEHAGCHVSLKAENLQRTGSFKVRGAIYKLHSLGERATAGVVAGSAGNHAQSLAFAARLAGVPCEIFVPEGAAIAKIAACKDYGATVVETGASLSEAVATARRRADSDGMNFCHPYDDPVVVAGQGTIGIELAEDIPDLRRVYVPLGGGGLATGLAIAVKSLLPTVEVFGVQVAVCAPYAGGEVPTGHVTTLADGIAVKQPGAVTKPLVERWLDGVVTVDEDDVADAMVLLMERSKLYVEGAGAVGVAAVLAGKVEPANPGTTCLVLSGGNVDLGVVPGLIRRHETEAGRRLIVHARISDAPGGLARLLGVFATRGASLIEVLHLREGINLHVRETEVLATYEVRGRDHAEQLVATARDEGFAIEPVDWSGS
jgi:threonine dehydratase